MISTIDALERLDASQETPEIGVMHVLDKTGDTEVKWDRTKPAEVSNARETFNRLRKEGYEAYAGDRLITDFDPNAGKMVMKPRMVGG